MRAGRSRFDPLTARLGQRAFASREPIPASYAGAQPASINHARPPCARLKRMPASRASRLPPRAAQGRSPNDPRHGSKPRPMDAPPGPGQGLRCCQCPPARTSMPNQRRRAAPARSKTPCTKREWCPVSLAVLDRLRPLRRTVTLTRAQHTPGTAANEQENDE